MDRKEIPFRMDLLALSSEPFMEFLLTAPPPQLFFYPFADSKVGL